MTKDAAQLAYLRWLSGAAPATFRRIEHRFRTSLGDLGWIQAVVQAVAAIGSAVLAKKQQDKQVKAQKKAQAAADAETARVQKELADTLVQVNTQRASKGLPPIDAQGNVIPTAYLPQPATLSNYYGAGGQVVGASINPMWIIAGFGGLAVVILVSRRHG